MKKNILRGILVIFVLAVTLASSCKKDDIVTPPTTGDCGTHRQFLQMPLPNIPSNTFMGSNNVRTIQFSVVGTGGITNVCSRSKPNFNWKAEFKTDSSRELTLRGVARWSAFGADVPGSITTAGNVMTWSANYTVGLEQAFGQGPANFHDARIDISFQSLGSEQADKDYLLSRFSGGNYYMEVKLDYEEYVSH
jgi:hypothetical protein